jgi:cytochrome c556
MAGGVNRNEAVFRPNDLKEFRDMNRKWATLAVMTIVSAFAAAGFSLAQEEDDSPLHKIMEKVQSENGKITKGIRNPVMFRKSQKDVVTAAENLVKLAKEAKPLSDVAKENKDIEEPVKKYDELSADFIKEAEDFHKFVSDEKVEQKAAKDAYKKVTKTCTACHDLFRPEE